MEKIILSAEEVAVLMMLHWPGPFPGGKGIGGILPYGVKNVLKWKNRIGLDNAVKRFKKKMKENAMWNSPTLGSVAAPVLYFEKAITVEKEKKEIYKSIYWGEGLFVMIDFREDNEYAFSIMHSIEEYDFYDLKNNDWLITFWERNAKGKKIKSREMIAKLDQQTAQNFFEEKK